MTDIPEPVLRAYGLSDAPRTPITVGWINTTYRCETAPLPLIVQRLHPAFAPPVNLDLDAITRRLLARGMLTPTLVRTADGEPCVMDADGGCWRALTYVEGRTVDALDPALARSAGALVGRFHRALGDFEHAFHFTRVGVHDTEAHLARLAEARQEGSPAAGHAADVLAITDAILEAASSLPALPPLPVRIIHGDLKATNIRFALDGNEAIAILDLDTLAHGTLAEELGDALRSWCNRTNEADPDARFDPSIFEAAMIGYADGVDGEITQGEIDSILPGAERISLELASRFAKDLYGEGYFGWDPSRFASRIEHNLARCRAQLGLSRSVRAQRDALGQVLARVFG